MMRMRENSFLQLLLLLAVMVVAAVPFADGHTDTFGSNTLMIGNACKETQYPEMCTSALAAVGAEKRAKKPRDLFDMSLEFAITKAHHARVIAYNLTFPNHDSAMYPPTGTYDCVELLDNTLALLDDVTKTPSDEDIETWLSAALTNQETCSESLAIKPPTKKEVIDSEAERMTHIISNSLSLHKSTKKNNKRQGRGSAGLGRKLLADDFPEWLTERDRRLLQASPEEITPDAVVALDGTGTHTSINEAIAFVSLAKSKSKKSKSKKSKSKKSKSKKSGGGSSSSSGGRQVIHIKAGTYKETIRVATKQKNVMLIGAGKGSSVIVGSRSAGSGWTTYNSATVAGMGQGFICRDLTIVNNAGSGNHQAVALRVGADRSVIYQCSIQGHQDTLYAHSNRQFYKQNDIYGSVDFIFGNAAAVFQSCNILPRKSSAGWSTITAQGRRDPNQNTGFSIQGCKISSDGVRAYLGRPWKKYARVVFMESYLDSSIESRGWLAWSGNFALSTLFYGEYGNSGPGSSTSNRVKWSGVHSSMSSSEASKFTVSNFIYGNMWIPKSGVSFSSGL